jgi:drug/metabolite transporter (DMT)-like permease
MRYLVAVSILWAFSFPLIKGSLVGLDSTWVACARLTVSLLVFLPFVRIRSLGSRTVAALVAIGAVQFGLMYVCYIAAFQFLPAHVIVLLTTTTPLFVIVFDSSLRRRLSYRAGLAALAAVAGGAVLQYPRQPLAANLAGILLLQCSNAAFAAGQVAYRRLAEGRTRWADREVCGVMYLGAVAVSGMFLVARGGPALPSLSGTQLQVVLYLGVVASSVGFFLWNRGARMVPAGTLAVMNNLKIPLGVIASLVLLREQTDFGRLLAGAGLMGAGLWLANRSSRCADSGT